MLTPYDNSSWKLSKPYKEVNDERALTINLHAVWERGGTKHDDLISCIYRMNNPCEEDNQLPLLSKKLALLLNMSRGLSLEDLKSYKLAKIHEP